jgi:two-component system response regulator LytT
MGNAYRTLSVLLVEDELESRDLLSQYITSTPELSLTGIAKTGSEALEKLQSESFDIVFLDIHLPVMSGLEVVEKMQDRLPYLIFITVSRQYALEAFDLGAVDYLHKPISRERFQKSVDKVTSFIQNHQKEGSDKSFQYSGLLVSDGESRYLIPHAEIIYISANDRRSIIHTEKRDYEVSKMISELEERLPQKSFMRIHRGNIVNLDFVVELQYLPGGRYQLFLKDEDETTLTVGRTFVPDLKQRIGF